MEQHQFKVLYSYDDEVYRIIDLTDTSIVGITEMYKNDDEWDKKWRVESNKELKDKKRVGAKVVGYGIFIYLDTWNSSAMPPSKEDYYRAVFRQMATHFKDETIAKNPDEFKDYLLPNRTKKEKDTPTNSLVSKTEAIKTETSPSKKKINKKHDRVKTVLIIVGCIIGFILFMILMAYLFDNVWYIALIVLCALAFIPKLLK